MRLASRCKLSLSSQAGSAAVLAAVLCLCLFAGIAGGITARAATGRRRSSTQASSGAKRATGQESLPRPTTTAPQPATTAPPAQSATFDVGQAMAHVSYLSRNIGAREEGTPGEASASTYIQQQLTACGYTVSTQSVPVTATDRTTQNVIAMLPGTQRPGRTIVLGAHMDSKNGPGANDNATGVAVLLELARVLKDNKKQVPAVEFVFFGGEEIAAGGNPDQHHWGSRYFVNNLSSAERAAVAGMIAVDMVGTGKDFYANNMGLAPQTMRDFMLEAASGSGLAYRKESGMSDHEPFDRAGVPDVWLEYTGGNPYHEPGDDFASVDSNHVQTVGTILQQFFEGYLTPERVDQL